MFAALFLLIVSFFTLVPYAVNGVIVFRWKLCILQENFKHVYWIPHPYFVSTY